jgi:Ni/Co efflux regulator RcnB
MKQLISVLVAAIFAAASVTVVAQEKKDEKTKAGQMDKKDTKKSKSTKKPTKKKGEGKKKSEGKAEDKK